jgi:hypothetical protein
VSVRDQFKAIVADQIDEWWEQEGAAEFNGEDISTDETGDVLHEMWAEFLEWLTEEGL